MLVLRVPFVVALLALAAQMPPLDEVLARAGDYVAEYERALGMIIAEERYDQRVPTSIAGVSGGRPSTTSRMSGFRSQAPERIRRRLKSDFLMMRLPGDAGDQWVGLRVAVEVDGREISDRAERMQAVFGAPTASVVERWQTLAEESARYNLGDVTRTTNVPTFALLILHPEHRSRFSFELADTDRVEGVDVWVVRFRESEGPTLITDPIRRVSIYTHGRLWIDPVSGRVVRTELKTGDPRGNELRSEVVVRYRANDDLGIWLPRDMKEKYEDRYGIIFEGDARYSNFQRFSVSTDANLTEEPAAEIPR